jgi:hypothetical protein
MLLNTRCIDKGAQSANGPTLLADDFAHVRLCDAYFDARGSLAIDFTNVYSVAIVNEGIYD